MATIVAILLLSAGLLAQAPAPQPKPELPVLKAGLGPCSADFAVKDEDGVQIYAASVHVKVRYGVFGVKRADLEVGTNSDGEARIEGLPAKAKPLVYEVTKDAKKVTAEQNVATDCNTTFALTPK
jgi:hypothetical protein